MRPVVRVRLVSDLACVVRVLGATRRVQGKMLLMAMAVLGLSLQLVPLKSHAAAARVASPPNDIVTQTGSDFSTGQADNVVVAGGIGLGTMGGFTPRDRPYRTFGLYTSAPLQAAHPFTWVSIHANALVPAASLLTLEVRTSATGASGAWSPWDELDLRADSPRDAALSADTVGARWQYRLTLYADDPAHGPLVRAVTITTTPAASTGSPRVPAPSAQPAGSSGVTYRVFATREGLVGGTTANGHVIVNHDHFVALPSRTALDCQGCSDYTVTITYNGHSTTQPVYDVGPWNIKDNYWHTPRAEFSDLSRGLPEAQTANQNGYNGGYDDLGYKVTNPAGIDLADGVFWDDLGMTNNDWVTVTYNWELAPTPTPTPTPPPSNPTLTAAPTTVPPGGSTGTTTLTWDTGNGSAGQVYVSVDGGGDTIFAAGDTGSQTASFIQPGSVYVFKLYAGTDHNTLLLSVTVRYPLNIMASPNPVPAGAGPGQTTIAWNTGDGSAAQVYLSQDGGPDTLFAAGSDGSASAPWIQAGSAYVFKLFAGTDHTTLLRSVTVREELNLTASPNPVPFINGLGSTTLIWDTGDGSPAQLYVSQDGQPDQLFGGGMDGAPDGKATANWIQAGSAYVFKLYAGTDHSTLLKSVTVRESLNLMASPTSVPITDGLGTSTIVWDTGDGSPAQIYVSQDGRPDQLFAGGTNGAPDGRAAANWIQAGSAYVFKLYAGTDHSTLLESVTVTGVSTGSPTVQPTASTTPSSIDTASATASSTPIAATATQAGMPGLTNTTIPTINPTDTVVTAPSATSTSVPAATTTQTTAPTATATNSAVSISTATPVPPTVTATPVPPSATPLPPTATATPLPPTATNTPTLPAVATTTSTSPASTVTPVLAMATSVPIPLSSPTTVPAPVSPATATLGGPAPTSTGIPMATMAPAATATSPDGNSQSALPTDTPSSSSTGRGTRHPASPTHKAVVTSHPSIAVTALMLPSAGMLSVSIRTAANAHVTVTLQVFGRQTVLVGKGKHRGRMVRVVVLYAATMRGTTGRQGRLTGRLPIAYRSARPVQAALSVIVHGKDSLAMAHMSVLLKPHH